MQIVKPEHEFKTDKKLARISEVLDNIIKNNSNINANKYYGTTNSEIKEIREKLYHYSDINVHSRYGMMYFNELNTIKEKLIRVLDIINKGAY